MPPECDNCGRELEVEGVEKPNTDWVKVVCSRCGDIKTVSIVRQAAITRKKE